MPNAKARRDWLSPREIDERHCKQRQPQQGGAVPTGRKPRAVEVEEALEVVKA